NIDDPIVGDNADEAELNKQILKSFRMSGLTLAEPEVVAGIDAGASGNSAVAPIYVKKDGTLGANSSAADAEGFGRVLADSDEITRIIGKNILSGDIAPRPVKRGIKTGCDWCEYKAVCGFEQGGGGYRAKGFVKRDG
ncbi:MAG: PD-(D/E)XK nuclease family protein, partial [Defluviitaleaceae bacterium]|nr:PD-(D/E)XK nuclease family protein [Defluviitaleaceae bacterium]